MAAKRIRTIPVHVLDDARVHLAPARPGHLRQGRLKTLCGRLAVTALSPFAAAGSNRCRTCFGKVDEEGFLGGEEDDTAPPAPSRRKTPSGTLRRR
jgi:hypothetical protein